MKEHKTKKEARYTVEFRESKSGHKHGKIIINADKKRRAISALLFTPEESASLLELIDKVEAQMHNNAAIK